MITDDNEVHPEKAELSIDVTLFGIIIDVNDEQSMNVELEMIVTSFPILAVAINTQPENAES